MGDCTCLFIRVVGRYPHFPQRDRPLRSEISFPFGAPKFEEVRSGFEPNQKVFDGPRSSGSEGSRSGPRRGGVMTLTPESRLNRSTTSMAGKISQP